MQPRQPPKVSNRGQTRAFYVFTSRRLDRVIKVRSRLEYRACLHFEIQPDLRELAYEPQTYLVSAPSGDFSYTPDFEVVFNSDRRRTFIEVKYEKDLVDSKVSDKLDAWKRELPNYVDFQILTEALLSSDYESNCRFVCRHGLLEGPLAEYQQGMERLRSLSSPICLGDLVNATLPLPEVLRIGATLHWEGRASLDLAAPIGPRTLLTWGRL